jgi:hypothetical protein
MSTPEAALPDTIDMVVDYAARTTAGGEVTLPDLGGLARITS